MVAQKFSKWGGGVTYRSKFFFNILSRQLCFIWLKIDINLLKYFVCVIFQLYTCIRPKYGRKKRPSQALLRPSQSLLWPSQALLRPSQALLGPSQALLWPSQTLLGPSQALLRPSQALLRPSQAHLGPSQALLWPSQALSWPIQHFHHCLD